MTADHEYSAEKQQGAIFEQMPGQSKPITSLLASEFKKCNG